jgi:hypothetical protein
MIITTILNEIIDVSYLIEKIEVNSSNCTLIGFKGFIQLWNFFVLTSGIYYSFKVCLQLKTTTW